nr:DUF814 domain-containing protein [Polyangiaceae bacterium]
REQTAPFREQAIRMLEGLDASFGNEWRRQRERKQSSERKAPYRTFRSRQGVPIWVGRDARRNDTLTQKVAKPHHLWLHARGAPGSHVVLAHAKGAVLTSENLLDAAHLAVHFSSLTKEVLLEVTYAEKRHVRKPRKSPPGAVVVDREKVLVLRVDASLLQSLLQSEEFTG